MEQPTPHQSVPSDNFDLSSMDLHQPLPIKRGGKSMAIALIVSTIFLLAACGIAGWMIYQKFSSPSTVQPTDTSTTKDAKNVSWQAPATIPATYTARAQNTASATTTFYFDSAAGCGITTAIVNSQGLTGTTATEATLSAIKAESPHITIAASTAGDAYKLTDTDNKEYDFESLAITQDVDAAGLNFVEQKGLTAYKQFGEHLAYISIYCKTAAWDAQKTGLLAILNAHKVKVEY